MTPPPALPSRDDVTAMLACLGDREPQDVGERISSLELTWLITKVEQDYQVSLDLADDVLARMNTVTGAIDELHKALAEAGHA
ncbi:MAG TPA: hypothetical protein VGS19_01780 [Streptosporangiaceae bacterium]|nr:hypothetical protein [Streptosporangiaceae bacterium]